VADGSYGLALRVDLFYERLRSLVDAKGIGVQSSARQQDGIDVGWISVVERDIDLYGTGFSSCFMARNWPLFGAITVVFAPAPSSTFRGSRSSASSNPSVARMATRRLRN